MISSGLDEAPEQRVTLSDLAVLSGISRFQLLRGFVRTVGITQHAYLLQQRVRLARRLGICQIRRKGSAARDPLCSPLRQYHGHGAGRAGGRRGFAADHGAPPTPAWKPFDLDAKAATLRRTRAKTLGIIYAGTQRSWSGNGPVEAEAGEIIMANPGEIHDGNPIMGRARSWRMLYVDPDVMSELLAGDVPAGSSRSDAARRKPLPKRALRIRAI